MTARFATISKQIAVLIGLLSLSCAHPGPRKANRPARGTLTIELVPRPLFMAPLLTLKGELYQLLFHLNFRNVGPRSIVIQRVELTFLRGEHRLSRQVLARKTLEHRLRQVAWIVMRDRLTIAAAHRYQGLLKKPKGDTIILPYKEASLTQQLQIIQPGLFPDRIRIDVIHGAGRTRKEFPVRRYRQKTRLRLPVQGKWWVMEGHRFDEHHTDAVLNSQNFAYDLGVLGTNLSTCSGDPRKNDSYNASGRPIVAAAAGTVIKVHDGVQENSPVGRRPVWRAILQQPHDLAGNFVILKHNESEYSTYMHLKPGIKVKPGDSIQAGQPLGLCGNSGNSLETHLHFQLQDGPDLFKASGLPVRFSDYTIHMAHLRLYVPHDRPMPLPSRLIIEPGRVPGAANLRVGVRDEGPGGSRRPLPRCRKVSERNHRRPFSAGAWVRPHD